MFFELSIIKKYLIPQKKHLSVSLIALMSVGVISLVVWLVLIFLSVTEGIEKNWLNKLTSLHGQVRIQPTEQYYGSYYYQIDNVSSASHYLSKTIGQKAHSLISDPYDPDTDQELPRHFPKPDRDATGTLKDPVRMVWNILEDFHKKNPQVAFQDFEISGAFMRLHLLRQAPSLGWSEESQNYLSQVSYLASFTSKNPHLKQLLLLPSLQDLNHLLFLADHHSKEPGQSLHSVLDHVIIHQMKPTAALWRVPAHLFPKQFTFDCDLIYYQNSPSHLLLTEGARPSSGSIKKVTWIGNDLEWTLVFADKTSIKIDRDFPIFIDGSKRFNAKLLPDSLLSASSLRDVQIQISARLQKQLLQGVVNWENLEIADATIPKEFSEPLSLPPPWVYSVKEPQEAILPKNEKGEYGVLLAKNFKDTGVKIGDNGYLSYSSLSLSGTQEQRLPIYVAGFYDPGIMPIGNKCILVSEEITRIINRTGHAYSIERTAANGIQVFTAISDAQMLKQQLKQAFDQAGIGSYWTVLSYQDYDFAKDLMQQFQSDKYLFTLIGVIILIVACSNIISHLVLLVTDKKKEIGILQAMGASKKSIALIFGGCGLITGVLGSLVGTALGLLTLSNLDLVVKFLSLVQGHDLFNALFFGTQLPHELSSRSLYFVLIATPIIGLIAGLIPAVKACRLNPSQILRSE